MLTEYLAVEHSAELRKHAYGSLVHDLTALPFEELVALAAGDLHVKTAACFTKTAYGGSDGDWLQKYKGTPLFNAAMELERQLIEIETAENAMRVQQHNPELWMLRDSICLKKRLLDLELAEAQEGSASADSAKEAAVVDKLRKGVQRAGELVSGAKARKLKNRARAHGNRAEHWRQSAVDAFDVAADQAARKHPRAPAWEAIGRRDAQSGERYARAAERVKRLGKAESSAVNATRAGIAAGAAAGAGLTAKSLQRKDKKST